MSEKEKMMQVHIASPRGYRWGDYPPGAWDIPSKAVCANCLSGCGCVLFTVGPHVRFEIEEDGLYYLGDLG